MDYKMWLIWTAAELDSEDLEFLHQIFIHCGVVIDALTHGGKIA